MDNYYLNYCTDTCLACGYKIQYWTNAWIICAGKLHNSIEPYLHWGSMTEKDAKDFFKSNISSGNPNAVLLDGQPQYSAKDVSSWVTIIGG